MWCIVAAHVGRAAGGRAGAIRFFTTTTRQVVELAAFCEMTRQWLSLRRSSQVECLGGVWEAVVDEHLVLRCSINYMMCVCTL